VPVNRAGVIPSLRLVTTGSAWRPDHPPAVVQQWHDVDGRLVAWGGVLGGRWAMNWPGLGTYQFGPFGDVDVFPAPGADPEALQDSFVRGVLPVVLVGREHEALHASGVATSHGEVVAFCARSGVGKSSLALGVAARGGTHWADDTVVFASEPGPPRTLSLPFPPRVDTEALEALGLHQRQVPRTPPGETAPVSRVYLLTRDLARDPAEPAIDDLPSSTLFERMLAHAHPFDLGGPERRRRMIERLVSIAGGVRGCEVRFAPSLAALPVLVEAVGRHIETG
jgi:hypothetical protein